MKFRKKPIVIEAWQFNGKDGLSWPKWIHDYRHDGLAIYYLDEKMWVPTLEGMMTVSSGDWIIQGIKGEVYPCKPDIFEATYESVEDGVPEH